MAEIPDTEGQGGHSRDAINAEVGTRGRGKTETDDDPTEKEGGMTVERMDQKFRYCDDPNCSNRSGWIIRGDDGGIVTVFCPEHFQALKDAILAA